MKSDIGAKLAIYPTPVYLIATYDREGKPNRTFHAISRYP